MILTDTKKSQAKTVIGLDSVAGVSVTSLQDGLFGLHLNEVSELVGRKGGGHLGLLGDRPLTLGLSYPLTCF